MLLLLLLPARPSGDDVRLPKGRLDFRGAAGEIGNVELGPGGPVGGPTSGKASGPGLELIGEGDFLVTTGDDDDTDAPSLGDFG